MPRIDRQSFNDAKTISETFLPQADVRTEVLGFLADAIDYAHGVSNSNWNLNLDKDLGDTQIGRLLAGLVSQGPWQV
ncbi:MAG: hypothetical protein GX354_11890 [Firmicutes bacterium]|nr:hypothetical protein [Bacillota bacterium]